MLYSYVAFWFTYMKFYSSEAFNVMCWAQIIDRSTSTRRHVECLLCTNSLTPSRNTYSRTTNFHFSLSCSGDCKRFPIATILTKIHKCPRHEIHPFAAFFLLATIVVNRINKLLFNCNEKAQSLDKALWKCLKNMKLSTLGYKWVFFF